jgi:hypothetical protein
MADNATEFLKATEVYLLSRLRRMTETAWGDAVGLLSSITDFDTDAQRTRLEQLKTDIQATLPAVDEIRLNVTKQSDLIRRMVSEATDELDAGDFDSERARRVAVKVGTALAAAEEAYTVVATHITKNAGGTVDEIARKKLLESWNPWVKPWKEVAATAGNLLNKFGSWLLDVDDLVDKLGSVVELQREGAKVVLLAKFAKSGTVAIPKGPAPFVTLDQVSFEAFLEFSEREVTNPTEAEKPALIQRGDKWYRGDAAILGLRFRALLQPAITKDPLLKKVLPGAEEPKTTDATTISLDTAQGFYLGDGSGGERAVLPIRWSFPGVELRELAFGLVRRPDGERDVTGFSLTTSIAAKMGDAVGMQVVGAGFIVNLDGVAEQAAIVDLPVSPRWPDQVGLRIKAGPITGGGFIQRVERTYTVNGESVKRVEFGGVFQLQILKFGVSAIVILSPDPFSLALVIGVRFPTAIELSWGFTLNGIGGILAVDRGLDLEALRKAMKEHILDKMLFPDNPVAEAPKLLDKVATIFPPRTGGFVVGPIVELGWGSQAKFVELKLGVVLALPDPMFVLLGSLRVRVPTKELPITDVRADVFVAITPDYLLLFASMRDSTIAGFKVAGDLGLYIQWSGSGAFELSVGGFHPEYEQLTGRKPKLGELDRVTIDLSPADAVKFVIRAYFAVTAGAVMLGVEGRLDADFKVITAKAWLTLDMIFIWSPRFSFKVSIEVGIEVELFGHTFASVRFRGSLKGTKPFELAGHIKVDVWFLPTFDEDLGPITWGEDQPAALPRIDALSIVSSALKEDEAWKAPLPDHAAQLVTLDEVHDVAGRIAHPLAGLEVSQTHVPLGVKISHIGASPVTADMVTIGTPTSTAGDAAAVSELRVPFPPGHFFELEGEQLLARSGFEDLQGGCRIAAATTPKVGASTTAEVAYRTYARNPVQGGRLTLDRKVLQFADAYVAASNVGRSAPVAVNPYLTKSAVLPPVDVAPVGTSVLADAATGSALLSALGVLTATEAAVAGAAVNAAGVAAATRITL